MAKRWNTENYSRAISLKYNGKFEVIEEFINLNTRILHKCLNDNITFYVKPKNLIKNGYCKECDRKNREGEFIKKLEKKHPHIILIESYKTLKISRVFCCTKHKNPYMFKKVPSSVLKSEEPCILCRKQRKIGAKRKNLKQMIKDILNMKDNKASNCKEKEIKIDTLQKVALDEDINLIKKIKRKFNLFLKRIKKVI